MARFAWVRTNETDAYTEGFANFGIYQNFTLERPAGGEWPRIPAGSYRVIIEPLIGHPKMYALFAKEYVALPLLLGVPGHEDGAIFMHPFNTADQSEGCLGQGIARTPGAVWNSKSALDRIMPYLETAQNDTEGCWLDITENFLIPPPAPTGVE